MRARPRISDLFEPAAFRTALSSWLAENDLTPHRDVAAGTTPASDHSLDAQQAQHLRALKALYDAGWMRYGWPESAGGLGGPAVLRGIVGEEIVRRGIDHPEPYSMLEVLIPTMIGFARPELTAEMVPKLLSGEESWCQGLSEPGSGSDLASLTTRAVQDGDNWIVNGQKVCTSFAQYASRCVLLARTGSPDTPNREAITAFFVDLDSPGVTVPPLRTTHDVDDFCEVYFDDVVVPASRLLGRPGDGWKLAMDLLPYERSACFWQRIDFLYARFDALVGAVRGDGKEVDSDLGAAYLALHTLRCRSRTTQQRLAEGQRLGPDTSVDKVLLSGAEQQLYDTVRNLLPGVVELDGGEWRTEYLYSRTATIYGDTAEVQRNVIARRLLDLGKE